MRKKLKARPQTCAWPPCPPDPSYSQLRTELAAANKTAETYQMEKTAAVQAVTAKLTDELTATTRHSEAGALHISTQPDTRTTTPIPAGQS